MDKKKILLVEDIYFNQVLIESMLVEWGYEVQLASDGAEALELIKSNDFSLIILDLMMPVMDGFMFLEEKNKLGIHAPVVVLSARNDMESIERALKLGALDFITKPFNSSDLENKVRAFLARESA